MHAHYHTLAACPLSCSCLLSVFLFFLSFLLYLSLSCFVVLPPPPLLFPVHGYGPFYTTCHVGFLLFYPLNAFILVWVFFPDHSLVCQLPNHHHLLVLAVPHPIPRQKGFILFVCSPWHSYPNKGGYSLSLSMMTCT